MRQLALIALFLPAAAICQPAPMFRGNLGHTGVYDAPGVPKFQKIKWRFQTGARVLSSPAIAGGAAYVGSFDGNLYAVDLAAGNLKWKFTAYSAVTSSPAVAAGFVYFGSFDGNFYAVDAASGQLKWKFSTEGERRFAAKGIHALQPLGESMPDPWDFFLSSPAVSNGTVYFGSGDGHVYALDAASGALKWKVRTGNVVHSSPAIADGVVYIGSWDSFLYALDAASGKEIWRFKTGEDPRFHNQTGIQSSPAVAGGTVYFGCRDSKVYAVDARTGQKKWEFSNRGSWVITSPAIHEGKVYFGTSDTALFGALDAATGARLFSLDAKMPVFSSPAIASGVAYFGTFDGRLHSVDLKTREPLWVFQTEASKQIGARYAKPDGHLDFDAVTSPYFYDEMVSGVAKLFTMGSILSSPVVDKDVVYFGSADGALYALM